LKRDPLARPIQFELPGSNFVLAFLSNLCREAFRGCSGGFKNLLAVRHVRHPPIRRPTFLVKSQRRSSQLPEAALAVLVFSVVAIGSALHAALGVSIPNESLLVIQVFLSVVAVTSLLVSVAVAERNRHKEILQKANRT